MTFKTILVGKLSIVTLFMEHYIIQHVYYVVHVN